MILRRLSQSLKEQNWAAITIEFVLLVAGVFLGIQAQQWHMDWEELRLERVYLERIQRDIALSIETNELNISRLTGYSDGQTLVVESLRRCALAEDKQDAFADGISDIGKVGPSVFVLNTVEEMLSAGQFSLIRNAAMRDVLNGLARDAKYQNNIFTTIHAQLGAATVTTSQRTLRTYVDHRGPLDPVAWSELDIDFAALCTDKRFQSAVSTVRYLTDAQISLNLRANASLETAKAVLDRKLGGNEQEDATP